MAAFSVTTEGIPAKDEARMYDLLKRNTTSQLLGPNCPGLISPGKSNVGIMPHEITKEGNVGVVSRSGTLTYQAVHELTRLDIGQSTCIGIGGDPVPGMSFIDVLEAFEKDEQTEAIVMIGEIGGSAEEEAAEYISKLVSKPVVSYIAGVTAPPGKKWDMLERLFLEIWAQPLLKLKHLLTQVSMLLTTLPKLDKQ